MTKKTREWSTESFRAMALERLRTCAHIGGLCKELGISSATLRRWRAEQAGYKPQRPALDRRGAGSLQLENERLKRALAEKTLEVDFFKGALQQIEARRQPNMASGARASTAKSEE